MPAGIKRIKMPAGIKMPLGLSGEEKSDGIKEAQQCYMAGKDPPGGGK